jgi:Tfp pilus assembly protein PilV
MVAIAVIAIALIPLLRLHLLSLDATLYAQDLTTAVGLAQEKMAEMASSPEPGERHGTFDAAIYKRFSWQTSIGESEEVSLPNLEASEDQEELSTFDIQHIAVTVSWLDGKREKLYTLESYAVQ